MQQSYTVPLDGPTSQTARPTWPDLCQLEPRLRLIECELLASPPPRGRRLWATYEWAKSRLRPLVGWFRCDEHPLLTTSVAYEAAVVHVVGLLERRRRRRAA